MLSTDLARAIIADREREIRAEMRLHALLPARPGSGAPFRVVSLFVPVLRVVRLPFTRLAAAWSR